MYCIKKAPGILPYTRGFLFLLWLSCSFRKNLSLTCPIYILASISQTYHDYGYIFTTRSGAPYNIQFINRLLRKIDIPGKKISTHIFRHTHISMLAEMNVPLKAIMNRVGHNDPNTTLQIYTHVTDIMRKELTEKLEKMSI